MHSTACRYTVGHQLDREARDGDDALQGVALRAHTVCSRPDSLLSASANCAGTSAGIMTRYQSFCCCGRMLFQLIELGTCKPVQTPHSLAVPDAVPPWRLGL